VTVPNLILFLLLAGEVPRASANDNRVSAGILREKVLAVRLVAREATWFPEEDGGPSRKVETFAEKGHASLVPGPLIRIPLGATIHAELTNELADTLAVFGFSAATDTIWLAPGATRTLRHKPAAGTLLYYAGQRASGKILPGGRGGQLVGAIIVDEEPPRDDRVFITTAWFADPVKESGGFFMAMNGKSWPYSEQLAYSIGDTVRWRVINAGGGNHPMHLHGFHFTVTARGAAHADTVYMPQMHRQVVTESLPVRSTMRLHWVPDRPGNWLFHCHDADHISGRGRLVIAGRENKWGAAAPYNHKQDTSSAATHHKDHLRSDMSGLVMAVVVQPRTEVAAGEQTTMDNSSRKYRLLIQERAGFYGTEPGLGYVLQEGSTPPARDSIVVPGPVLVAEHRQELLVTVVSLIRVPTSVHWHGIELMSFFDGVAGWSGQGNRTAPLLAPGDSFVVRFTPPRTGTFIYHAHVSDREQLSSGLYGPLLVLNRGDGWDPKRDHVFVFGVGRPYATSPILLNGADKPAPLRVRAGMTHRFRFINIAPEDGATIGLVRDSARIPLIPLAKDGADLPNSYRVARTAIKLFPGETADFQVTLERGTFWLLLDGKQKQELIAY
jgi:manganese oxidase